MNEIAFKIAKKSKSSFFYAFNLLPSKKRSALNAIYSFCRISDDIVDNSVRAGENKEIILTKWKEEFLKSLANKSSNQFLNFVALQIKKYNIPIEHFIELLDGMQMDLTKNRYETFDELLKYCYKVASTVGLMCIEVFGYESESTKDFARNLGYAMQLTNIIRDFYKDAEADRIYLPAEDLKEFGVQIDEIKNKVFDERIKNLLKKEANRAKYYYNLAEASLDFYDRKKMFPALAMGEIYYRLLLKIESHNYNVLSSKIKVNLREKLEIALKYWLKSVFIY